MLKNLLKVSIRNIQGNRIYSLLNILGLTLGITCSILLGLYILDELSFDNFHTNKDRIYRVITTFIESGKETNYSTTQIPLGLELQDKYTQVEHTVRLIETGRELFENPIADKRFYEEYFYYADPSVFEVFSFTLISGDLKTALNQPYTAVLTESTAKKFFGDDNPLEKSLENKGKVYKITGILKDVPANSHLKFDALLSFNSFPKELATWDGWFPHTYLLVKENIAPEDLDKILAKVNEEHVAPIFKNYGITLHYWTQPLLDIHLKSNFGDEAGESGNVSYIYIFAAIGLFILIIANINYINLATARATRRAKEIGIRKTMGSFKHQIVVQFITESTMLTFISLLISIILITTLLPYFNELSGKQISFLTLFQPKIVIGSICLALLVGIAGGSYPAFYLSLFNPALVLKGNVTRGRGNARLRKILIVLQFAISIGMLICTSVVYDQLTFLQEKDLGFNRDHILTVTMPDSEIQAKSEILYHRLKAHTNIVEVSTSSTTPGKELYYSVMTVDSPEGEVSKGVNFFFANFNFVETMGISVISGRSYSKNFPADSTAALVNETMVKSMQWDDPVGKRFILDDGNPETVGPIYTIVGVIKDYHQQSLHSVIKPLAIFFKEQNYYLNIKIIPTDLDKTLEFIDKVWEDVNVDKPFSYSFLDQDFQAQYKADQKRGEIFSLFSIVSVLISCVGLFGLASYTTEQRAKEIGIRKVIGASLFSIVGLFYKDFLILIGIALLIAFPLTYFFMSNWLNSFAYQTEIKSFTFVSATLLTLVTTMTSISYHTIKSAMSNPTTSLRSE